MYHSIDPDATRDWGPWQYSITPNRFEAQIQRLSKACEPIAIAELCADEPLPDDAVVVTFDDGFRDTLTRAVPILERYGVPATVYVATGYLDGGSPYEFRLAETLRQSTRVSVSTPELKRRLNSHTDILETYNKLRKWARHGTAADRAILIDQLSSAPPPVKMLSRDEIRTLDAHRLITVGAHGHNHLPLGGLSADAVQYDISRCCKELNALLSTPVRHFSYPYGSFDDDVSKIVESLNFETAATTSPGSAVVGYFGEQRYELPRIDASESIRDVC